MEILDGFSPDWLSTKNKSYKGSICLQIITENNPSQIPMSNLTANGRYLRTIRKTIIITNNALNCNRYDPAKRNWLEFIRPSSNSTGIKIIYFKTAEKVYWSSKETFRTLFLSKGIISWGEVLWIVGGFQKKHRALSRRLRPTVFDVQGGGYWISGWGTLSADLWSKHNRRFWRTPTHSFRKCTNSW